MILGNIKEIKKTYAPKALLRFLLAVIFLSAGIFRILNFSVAELEMKNLQLPHFLSYLLIIFEIIIGIFLFLGRYLKNVYSLLIGFLSLALLWGLIIDGDHIARQAGELFIFKTTALDFFMHLVFLVILISLYLDAEAEE